VRRPVRVSCAPRRCRARAIACPIPPVAPVSSAVSSGQMLVHGPNTASVAVKPCRWARPPTARSRPRRRTRPPERPQTLLRRRARRGRPRRTSRARVRCRGTSVASVSAPPNGAALAASTCRRSVSALKASRRVQAHDLAGSTYAPTAIAPFRVGAEQRAHEESPALERRFPNRREAGSSPSATCSRSLSGSAATASRSAVSAGAASEARGSCAPQRP